MVGFDETSKFFFESSVASILRDRKLPSEIVDLVPRVLGETYMGTKSDLGVTFPVRIRTLDLFSVVDQQVIRSHEHGSFNMAFLVPKVADNKILAAELVINDGALVAYSKSIERKGGGKPFTPWKLIGHVAHEMRHGWQWQEQFERTDADLQNPYDAQWGEYDANDYAYQWIGRQKPWGILDRVDRAFERLDLKNDLKRISENRRRLGLD